MCAFCCSVILKCKLQLQVAITTSDYIESLIILVARELPEVPMCFLISFKPVMQIESGGTAGLATGRLWHYSLSGRLVLRKPAKSSGLSLSFRVAPVSRAQENQACVGTACGEGRMLRLQGLELGVTNGSKCW